MNRKKSLMRSGVSLLLVLLLCTGVFAFIACGPSEEKVGYSITFDDNRGASEQFNTYPNSGVGRTNAEGKLIAMPTPLRLGYDFAGWCSNADGTGDKVAIDAFDAEGTKTMEGTKFTKDTTLYAVWKQLSLSSVASSYPDSPSYTGLMSTNVVEHTFDVTAASFNCQFGLTTGEASSVRKNLAMTPRPSTSPGISYHYYGSFAYFANYFIADVHLYFHDGGMIHARVDAVLGTEAVGTWTKTGNNITFSTAII